MQWLFWEQQGQQPLMKIQLHIVAESLHNCSLYLETQRPAKKLQCEKSGRAPEAQRSNCWCNGTHQLLKKYWKRKFSLIGTLQRLHHRNQSKSNYIGLRGPKTKPKGRLPCQHQQVEETLLKYPFPHKSVPQHPPFHYCHSIPSWRTQLLPSQNSGLPHWFLEE